MVNIKKHSMLKKKNNTLDSIANLYIKEVKELQQMLLLFCQSNSLYATDKQLFTLAANFFQPFIGVLHNQEINMPSNIKHFPSNTMPIQAFDFCKKITKKYNINALFIDLQDDCFNNKFFIFQIFEQSKEYDFICMKNMTLDYLNFFDNYGLFTIVRYGIMFFKEKLSRIQWLGFFGGVLSIVFLNL